ncbi:hypothetical protein GCM10017691_41210 [Pseudonocardia petroleophila]
MAVVEHRVEIVDVVAVVDSVTVSTVRAVAEAVHPPGVTRADLEAVVALLLDGLRESASAERIARRVEDQAPMFVQLGRFLRTPNGVFVVLGVLLTLAAFVRDVAADAAPEAPPSVIVEVEGPSSADVERIVEERLRELTESGGSLPGAGDGAPE